LHPEIKVTDHAAEFRTEERCLIIEVSNDEGDEALSIARARVLTGDTTEWHRLDGIAERYVILSGTGRAEIEGMAPADVGPGDVVLIPPGAAQRIANTGDDDLVFYCLCTPRFRQSKYINCTTGHPG
jgi:mannose-6-phosphate isomerase-like protein (cupin superfamily)